MSLMKHVIPVLFTDSKYWLDECKNYKVHCITDFEYIHFKKESMNLKTRMNSFKLPFFFGLFRSAIKHFPNVPFYGYINGDILVEQSITDVLFHVEEQIQTAALVNKVLSSRTQSWSRLLYILNETTFILMLKWICIPIWRTKIQNRFTIYLWNKWSDLVLIGMLPLYVSIIGRESGTRICLSSPKQHLIGPICQNLSLEEPSLIIGSFSIQQAIRMQLQPLIWPITVWIQ